MRNWILGGLITLASTQTVLATSLQDAVSSPHRTAEYRARDAYRHPLQTLEFFGIRADMTVVELWPGAGWYTEILAPFLKDHGKFYAAHFPADSAIPYFQKSRAAFEQKLAASPELYGKVLVTAFDPPGMLEIAPAGTADAVLTFRNVHNWYMRGGGEARMQAALAGIHKALKTGGVLGIVDHRLPEDRPLSEQDSSGYMRQDFVIAMAQQAGFEWVASSEINANPLDPAQHPKGVWTLPPILAGAPEDAATYLTIGESDRMTLLFRKP